MMLRIFVDFKQFLMSIYVIDGQTGPFHKERAIKNSMAIKWRVMNPGKDYYIVNKKDITCRK